MRGRAVRSARLAHTQEVEGSNPSPATQPLIWFEGFKILYLMCINIKQSLFLSFSVLAAPVIKASVYIAEDWSK